MLPFMFAHAPRSRLIALLGPTNTGKTHLALERMLGYRSGMIGFPLRLLARESYDRVARIRGAGQVALITGEEKIIPPHPSYFVCTVESMPLDRAVAFLAVDEIQLCADPERGHVFTERLLHARGLEETMLLGAETIRPLIRRLVPEAAFVARPRLSRLVYTAPCKLTRVPPRTAIVAFSAADVYAIAELIRRNRGGAAVVLGALSPRTRNAQVALYQGGEVDYMVATDAIGMGLNMDIDHVLFAALRKFDGRVPRDLMATEVAQIAGRAGRHMNDGTFSTALDIGPMDPEMVARVENHTFPPLTALFWRNARLRHTSIAALLSSLQMPPPAPGLVRAPVTGDQLILEAAAHDADVQRLTTTTEAVRRLWEVCQIPDFRKVGPETHARLVSRLYHFLMEPAVRLLTDWMADQVARLERTTGDIDALVERIASIRIWSYVAYRPGWLEDSVHWQERTRAIEDGLSDALHERLTQRFVDRRTAVLVRHLRNPASLHAAVADDGTVRVEGHYIGRLSGFRFGVDTEADARARRAALAAASKSLPAEITRRVRAIEAAPDDALVLTDAGVITWHGAAVGRLMPGADVLRPGVSLLASDLLDAPLVERIHRRLETWLAHHMATRLGPLMTLRETPLKGMVRGLAFQLMEALGTLPRRAVEGTLSTLSAADRATLAQLGVRIGTESVFLPAVLKPACQRLTALLWRTCHAPNESPETLAPPSPGRICRPAGPDTLEAFQAAIGFRALGGLAVRADMLERFAAAVRVHLRSHRQARDTTAVPLPAHLFSMLGVDSADGARLLRALGYGVEEGEAGLVVHARQGRRGPRPHSANTDSPFARLKSLTPG